MHVTYHVSTKTMWTSSKTTNDKLWLFFFNIWEYTKMEIPLESDPRSRWHLSSAEYLQILVTL